MQGRGWVAMAPGRLYYRGQIDPGSMHAHHAVQLLVGDGLVLRGSDGIEHACSAALIPANAPHAIVEGTLEGLVVLMEPTSAASRDAKAATWRIEVGERVQVDGVTAAETLVAAVTGAPPPDPRHPALIAAAEVIADLLPGGVRLGEVARAVHLSESRLSWLFREELGVPFRPYVLWERLRRALDLLSSGRSLTQAAHEAGFADAPHMTRVFRRMFGASPSELTRDVRWV